MSSSLEDRIRERAYAIWEKNGRLPSTAEKDWKEAELDIRDKTTSLKLSDIPMGWAALAGSVLTVIGGILGAIITNILGEHAKNSGELALESQKFEIGLIERTITSETAENQRLKSLLFLACAGFIPTYKQDIINLARNYELSCDQANLVVPSFRTTFSSLFNSEQFHSEIKRSIEAGVSGLAQIVIDGKVLSIHPLPGTSTAFTMTGNLFFQTFNDAMNAVIDGLPSRTAIASKIGPVTKEKILQRAGQLESQTNSGDARELANELRELAETW